MEPIKVAYHNQHRYNEKALLSSNIDFGSFPIWMDGATTKLALSGAIHPYGTFQAGLERLVKRTFDKHEPKSLSTIVFNKAKEKRINKRRLQLE